jgi:hypothetical protein
MLSTFAYSFEMFSRYQRIVSETVHSLQLTKEKDKSTNNNLQNTKQKPYTYQVTTQ